MHAAEDKEKKDEVEVDREKNEHRFKLPLWRTEDKPCFGGAAFCPISFVWIADRDVLA